MSSKGETISPAEIAGTVLSTDASRPSDGRVSAVVTRAGSVRVLHVEEARADGERYVDVGELGRGGMGRVAEVVDTVLGRSVAKKTLLRDSGDGAGVLLVSEAQICAQLEHPAIVPVYDLGEESGEPWYTMRVVRGRNLREVLIEGRHSRAQLLGVLRQVCLAVDYAHSRGVVHRDLKPANIILGEFGEVYVLDWGVAHVLEGSDIHRSHRESFHAGSPGYMAPEQIMGEAIDTRTDVFALGVILHELLTGIRPFDDRDVQSMHERVRRGIVAPPSARLPAGDVPKAFDALVMSCLARDPAERPPSARAITDAIDRFLDAERAAEERLRAADAHVAEAEAAHAQCESLAREARRLRELGEQRVSALGDADPLEIKERAWSIESEARKLTNDAALAFARAAAAYTRALGHVDGHPGARAGLARLHYSQFEDAELLGDEQRMTQSLSLAREYDDGALALELAGRGQVVVETAPDVEVSIARFDEHLVRLLRLGPSQPLTREAEVDAGSYLVTLRQDDREIHAPLLVRRARRHRLSLRMPAEGEIPSGMVLVPGGPFLALEGTRDERMIERSLPDFAIGRFPVTLREYAAFLRAIDGDERASRMPRIDSAPLLDDDFRLNLDVIEGEAQRARLAGDAGLDLPVLAIRWWDAMAYVRWLARETGLPYRLPTDLEWDKAARGADGRPFPMGKRLDPGFAKLRESRAEYPPQPEPIGAFPLDVSPYGVRDLAGGVGEWTATGADLSDLRAVAQMDGEDRVVIWRGGGWGMTSRFRGTMRFHESSLSRPAWIGFRVALDCGGASSSLETSAMSRPA
jgi:serine/threonine-protein kinase